MLRILHSHGVAREGMVPLHPEGRGVSEALALGEPCLIDALWRDANRCRIAWRSEGWTLSNESRLLVCALDGRRVRSGEQAVLRLGNVLELGLARFLVDQEKPVDAGSVRDSAPRRLAPPVHLPDTGSAPHGPGVHDAADATASAGFAIDWGQLAPVAELFPAPVHQAAGRVATDVEPLDGLHEEFLRVARDPSQLAGRGDWDGFTASPADGAPTLAGLAEQASVYATLRDIVLRREDIDEIIDAFDSGTQVEPWAAVPEMPEILGLFMPGHALGAPVLAPSLTRREHHALSPDSPMPPSAARPPASDERRPEASTTAPDQGARHVDHE